MNNLIIAALTFVMLPALSKNAEAQNEKGVRAGKREIAVEKINFTEDIAKYDQLQDAAAATVSVDVDYIIEENGKGYITYINSESEQAKQEVIKFIEQSTYHYNLLPGKVYSMKLSLQK